MNDKWLEFAIRIQSLAQAGLQYGKDNFDIERYEELRQISAEMMAMKTDISTEIIKGVFCNESGYQTPKIDTRAAVFENHKILMVQENNEKWTLPGGWCDVDQSIASNTEKEVFEETGYRVLSKKLIAVQDWRKHNVQNYAYGVIKTFMLCKNEGGSFVENIETKGMDFFTLDDIPKQLSTEKVTLEQIKMCFDAYENDKFQTLFD